MYRIITGSKDTYITNKIIDNSFRVTDANTGKAASIDLFKLYAESTSGSDASPIEISRGLLKFDLDPLRQLTGTFLDIDHSSFKCTLELSDIYGGQTTPSNFKLIVFPLSKSFDEGPGIDVVKFNDLGPANFITASVSLSSASKWDADGANKIGLLGSRDIDVIASGNLNDGNGVVNLWKEQTFANGDENLSIDITSIVSGTLVGLIPDHGFRLSYSGTQETDKVTRFVKRFASTQHSNYLKRPKIVVQYNDTTQDHNRSFFFNISGSIFMNNFHRGVSSNILSGASSTKVEGDDCIVVRLVSGTFSKSVTGSQHKIGKNYITGVYSASFAISEFENSSLRNEIIKAGSGTFKTYWGSKDYTVGYLTSSLVIKSVNRTSFNNESKRVLISITNLREKYRFDDKARFRVFAEDVDRVVKAKKLPFETESQIFTSLYYRIRDFESGEVRIPFATTTNGTQCSTDSKGMYFDVYMSSLDKGRLYSIEFLLKDQGFDQIFTDVAAKFRVV